MRVQDLLLTAPFLGGITESLVVIRRRLRAFKDMAESIAGAAEIHKQFDLRSIELRTFGFPFATMSTRHHPSPNRYWTRAREGVMLSLTTEEIRACIPFGAAHRMNLTLHP